MGCRFQIARVDSSSWHRTQQVEGSRPGNLSSRQEPTSVPPLPNDAGLNKPIRDSGELGDVREHISVNLPKLSQKPVTLKAASRSDHVAGAEVDSACGH